MKHGNISIFVPHLGCPNQCSFCDQHMITGQVSAPCGADVVQAVEQALSGSYAAGAEMEIAFFGGSFTAIPYEYMEELLQAAAPYIRAGRVKGIRVSTRPDCVDSHVLSVLKSYGVSAVELGAQSMDNEVLRLNRRGHTAEDVARASALVQSFGFSLGLQMMTGLYGSSRESDLATGQAFLRLRPDTVRIYPTVVLKQTYLAQLMEQGLYRPQSLEEAVEVCAKLLLLFEGASVPVIRMGLHSSESLQLSMVGGAYHPAFRELVENKIYLDKALEALKNCPKGNVIIYVAPGCVSKMAGQKRRNLILLERLGYQAKVAVDSGLSIKGAALRAKALPGGRFAGRIG